MFPLQKNGLEREERLKKINEKISASQRAKKPGKLSSQKSDFVDSCWSSGYLSL